MREIITIQQLSDMYNISEGTARVYIDGYKLSKYKKSRTSIFWCDGSKKILDNIVEKSKKDPTKVCLSTRVRMLEREVERLKSVIVKLIGDVDV